MLMVNSSQLLLHEDQIKVVTSGSTVSGKELFILGLFFSLFFYSIFSFLKIWNNTYRTIETFYYFKEQEPMEVESPLEPRKLSVARRQSSRKQSAKPKQFSHIVGVGLR